MREAEEPFRAGAQKGSSAMPHKRNPITSERICGLARVLRGNAQVGLEDVALWHERDISHSSAERVVLPDATIRLDYLQHLGLRLVARAWSCTPTACARTSTSRTARCSPSACCWRSSPRGWRATRPTASSRRPPSRRGTRGTPLRDLLAARDDVDLDLDDVFDLRTSRATRARSSRASTRSPERRLT